MYKKARPKDHLWLWVLSGFVVVFLLFAIPFTRQIVVFILPLGSGWDDFVFVVTVIFIMLILSVRGIISLASGAKFLRRIFDPTYNHYEQDRAEKDRE